MRHERGTVVRLDAAMNPAVLVPSAEAVLCDVGDSWVLEVGGMVLAEGEWVDMMLLADWYDECCAAAWLAAMSPVLAGWAQAA